MKSRFGLVRWHNSRDDKPKKNLDKRSKSATGKKLLLCCFCREELYRWKSFLNEKHRRSKCSFALVLSHL